MSILSALAVTTDRFSIALAAEGPASVGQHKMTLSLSLDDARRMAAAAETHARQNGTSVVVTILDAGGHVILTERMEGAQLASLALAQRKAISAIYYKRPSRAFEQALAGGRTAVLALPDAMPAGGGIPLMQDGVVYGAIGVSGGNNDQDQAAAEAGVTALARP